MNSLSGQYASLHRVSPGVAAIIADEDGRMLLHRRVIGAGWSPPTAPVGTGQTIEGALRDCVTRETGLLVALERVIGIYSHPDQQVVDYDGIRVQWVTTVIGCHVLRGPVRDCDEGGPWRWFPVDALPGNLLPYARRWITDALADEALVLA